MFNFQLFSPEIHICFMEKQVKYFNYFYIIIKLYFYTYYNKTTGRNKMYLFQKNFEEKGVINFVLWYRYVMILSLKVKN